MWVCLNKQGKEKYGDIFPDGKVPVCSMSFSEATIGEDTIAEIVLVSWKALSVKQQKALLDKVNETLGGDKEELAFQIASKGLPLRKSLTSGVICADLRFFI